MHTNGRETMLCYPIDSLIRRHVVSLICRTANRWGGLWTRMKSQTSLSLNLLEKNTSAFPVSASSEFQFLFFSPILIYILMSVAMGEGGL